MIYNIQDKPKKWFEWIIYPIQMLMSVFVATVLIATLCGTPISSCLIGGCIGTLIYQLFTRFKSPMFISNSGATVSAVVGALALMPEGVQGQNYFAVLIGGIIILVIYAAFALIVKLKGVKSINKIFPPAIVGSVTIVIGLTLATFIPGYVGLGTDAALTGMLIGLATMLITAAASHYFKGFLKNIPFLIGLIGGSILAVICLFIGKGASIPNMDIFDPNAVQAMKDWIANPVFFALPDFAFLHLGESVKYFDINVFIQTLLYFAPVAVCALLEHYSDHKVLSNIVNKDLTVDPGLDKTLLGDGVASVVGTVVCGLPNTSYGESIATIGFSKVASVWVTLVAALIMGLLAFIAPVQIILQLVPKAVFGGCAMILYGYIAASGLKTIINNKVDLEDNKNLILVSVILTVGVGGLFIPIPGLGGFQLKETALAMILGIILNLVLKFNKKEKANK